MKKRSLRELGKRVEVSFEQLAQQLADLTPEDFSSVWGRCIMADRGADARVLFQPLRQPGLVDWVQADRSALEELRRGFSDLRAAMKENDRALWTSATLVVTGEGHLTADFTWDVLPPGNEPEFDQSWAQKHLEGLVFEGAPLPAYAAGDAPAEHKLLFEQSMEELRLKTAVCAGPLHLAEAAWSVDQDRGTITFTHPDGTVATAPVQIVGSWLAADSTWLWAWANPSVLPAIRKDAEVVRDFGRKHRLVFLTTAKVQCDEAAAWELAALACKLAGAQAVYRGPTRGGNMFMAFGTVTLRK